MTAKLYQFNGPTLHDLPPDQVLQAAIGELSKVIVLGFKESDGSLYMAASCGNIAEAIYLLEKCKRQLLDFGEE